MTKPAPKKLSGPIETLSPEARQVVETKKFTGAWSFKSFGKLLSELQQWDKMAEERKRKSQRLLQISLISLFIDFMVSIFVGAILESVLIPLCLLTAGGAFVYIAWRQKKAALAIDLPNELSQSVYPFLKTIAPDIHPEERIRIEMDFTGTDTGGLSRKLTGHRFVSLTETIFNDVKCHLRIPLRDGSEATLRMENDLHKFSRSYRSSRGKTKSKTKWTKVTTVIATLIPGAPCSWRRETGISFIEKGNVTAARAASAWKFKSVGEAPGDAVPARAITALFLRLVHLRENTTGGAQ
jgi:hypothetical protein